MNLNPTVKSCGNQAPQPNSFSFYPYPVDFPHSINITLANTNLNNNYIIQDYTDPRIKYLYSENRDSNDETKHRLKSNELGFLNLQNELKKEKQKNQILMLRVIELEQLMGSTSPNPDLLNKKKNIRPFFAKSPTAPMKKDQENETIEEKAKENKEKVEEKDKKTPILQYVSAIEEKIQGLLGENENMSKVFHEIQKELSQKIEWLEEKHNEKNKVIEALLSENEKLRGLIEEINSKSNEKIRNLTEEMKDQNELAAQLKKENCLFVHSIAITNERQSIEKNKLASCVEQISYLENKNRILEAEIERMKGKN